MYQHEKRWHALLNFVMAVFEIVLSWQLGAQSQDHFKREMRLILAYKVKVIFVQFWVIYCENREFYC